MQVIYEVEYDTRSQTNLGKEEELAKWLENFVGRLRRREVNSFRLVTTIEYNDDQS